MTCFSLADGTKGTQTRVGQTLPGWGTAGQDAEVQSSSRAFRQGLKHESHVGRARGRWGRALLSLAGVF